ncbi:SPASM domain-containing protein [Kosakonia sp.]|uniref:SPASM domain-containing protein n=1 Tax=Kosakonia sp. TaxID=1916651 RepID=UPI00289A9A85|nr:SPASM domain-containing protein [Kosakonia sp.]
MQGCHVMVRPVSTRCHLHCCDGITQHIMDGATLEAFIRQQFAAQPTDAVMSFVWQGEEPTLCGLDFFHRVAALQALYANGRCIENVFQTSGIHLNDAWCRLFHEQDWQVEITANAWGDADCCGKSAHTEVINAIETLRKHRIVFSLHCAVNNLNSQQPLHLYRYLRALGTPFLQFIPCVEQDADGNLTPASVSAEAWGHFLTTVFDCWAREDIGRVNIQLFESTLSVWRGAASPLCSFDETCEHILTVDADGDVYPCDRDPGTDYRPGHLYQSPIHSLNTDDNAFAFRQRKKNTLSDECRHCDVLRLCGGDCPQHRFMQHKSALCAGYYRFFSHSAPYMRVMRDLLNQRRSPMELMAILRERG